MEKLYYLRAYDPSSGNFITVTKTYEQIIENPFGLHSNDIVYAILGKLRADRGLEPLPKNSIVELGENNG